MGCSKFTFLLSVLALITFAAAEEIPASTPQAALARYLAGVERSSGDDESAATRVEIQASIPKLGKRGYFRGIRRHAETGTPEYQVLEVGGDTTVKQQVIARYLVAEAQAAAVPSSEIAIVPENYKFRYAGEILAAGRHVYVFEITPKKKRTGLIAGQLWIDTQTGAAVHESGHLVKTPSVFVRRIEITRDSEMRENALIARVTHVDIDTRVAGRATLLISEQPSDASISTLIAHNTAPERAQ